MSKEKIMFDFLNMVGNYEQRKVDRFEQDDLIIDTCAVNDINDYDYETGIEHPSYNKGSWVIVEQYKTKAQAKKGHKNWIKIMTSKKLPKQLKDVSTCNTKQFMKML